MGLSKNIMDPQLEHPHLKHPPPKDRPKLERSRGYLDVRFHTKYILPPINSLGYIPDSSPRVPKIAISCPELPPI